MSVANAGQANEGTIIMGAELKAEESTENTKDRLIAVATTCSILIRAEMTKILLSGLRPDELRRIINDIEDKCMRTMLLTALDEDGQARQELDERPIAEMPDLREVFSIIPRTSNSPAENARAFERVVRRAIAGGIVTSNIFWAYKGNPNEPLNMLVLAAIQAVDTPNVS